MNRPGVRGIVKALAKRNPEKARGIVSEVKDWRRGAPDARPGDVYAQAKGRTIAQFGAEKKQYDDYNRRKYGITAEEEARIDSLFQDTLGREAGMSALITYKGESDAAIKKELVTSTENAINKGWVSLVRNEGSQQGYMFFDTPESQAALRYAETAGGKFGPGDYIILPKSVSDLDSGGKRDLWDEQEGETITAEMLAGSPDLQKAGYQPGDKLRYAGRMSGVGGGFEQLVSEDLGLGEDVGKAVVATVGGPTGMISSYGSDELKFAADPLAISGDMYDMNYSTDARRGGSRLLGTSEENIAKGQSYANAVVDAVLPFVPGWGWAAAAAKQAAQSGSAVARGQINLGDAALNVGQTVASNYFLRTPGPGSALKQFGLNTAFNTARGQSFGESTENAAYATLGSRTYGATTMFRRITDPNPNESDFQFALNLAGDFYGSAGRYGGYPWDKNLGFWSKFGASLDPRGLLPQKPMLTLRSDGSAAPTPRGSVSMESPTLTLSPYAAPEPAMPVRSHRVDGDEMIAAGPATIDPDAATLSVREFSPTVGPRLVQPRQPVPRFLATQRQMFAYGGGEYPVSSVIGRK